MKLKEAIKAIGQDVKSVLARLTGLEAGQEEIKEEIKKISKPEEPGKPADDSDFGDKVISVIKDVQKMTDELGAGMTYPFLIPLKDNVTGTISFVPIEYLTEDPTYKTGLEDGQFELVESLDSYALLGFNMDRYDTQEQLDFMKENVRVSKLYAAGFKPVTDQLQVIDGETKESFSLVPTFLTNQKDIDDVKTRLSTIETKPGSVRGLVGAVNSLVRAGTQPFNSRLYALEEKVRELEASSGSGPAATSLTASDVDKQIEAYLNNDDKMKNLTGGVINPFRVIAYDTSAGMYKVLNIQQAKLEKGRFADGTYQIAGKISTEELLGINIEVVNDIEEAQLIANAAPPGTVVTIKDSEEGKQLAIVSTASDLIYPILEHLNK